MKKPKVEISFKSKTIAIILVLLGIILFAFSFEEMYKSKVMFGFIEKSVVCKVLESIGLTLISAGLVSTLLEISSVQNMFDKSVSSALNKVLNFDFPLKSYSNEKLKEIHDKSAREISENNLSQEDFNSSVYSIENRLLDSTNNLYYDYHHSECKITVCKDYLLKETTVDYKVVNTNNFKNELEVILIFADYKSGLTDLERERIIDIMSFQVNNTDLTSTVKKNLQISKVSGYNKDENYKYSFGYRLQNCKNHKVHIEYSYRISKNDLTQGYKLSYPCKDFRHMISIHSENSEWSLQGQGFTAFYCKTFDSKKYKFKQKVKDLVEVDFEDWALPGAGYLIVLNPC